MLRGVIYIPVSEACKSIVSERFFPMLGKRWLTDLKPGFFFYDISHRPTLDITFQPRNDIQI